MSKKVFKPKVEKPEENLPKDKEIRRSVVMPESLYNDFTSILEKEYHKPFSTAIREYIEHFVKEHKNNNPKEHPDQSKMFEEDEK